VKKSPRVVWEVIIGINSSSTLLKLQTACLTAPEASGIFPLLCSPSMLLCYRMLSWRAEALGDSVGTGDLTPEGEVQAFDGNVEVDLWALFP